MKQKITLLAALCAALLATPAAFAAAPITNADVIKLLDAGMPEDVVLDAIANGKRKFDTSSSALITLKSKGATPAILKAVLADKDSTAATAGKPQGGGKTGSSAKAAGGYNPEEVTLVVDGSASTMQYIIPQTRTAARALGLGGFATYASLSGPKALRRLTSNTPEFIVSVPKNAQATNYLTLANFEVRKNDTREVLTGGGYMSYSSGIHKNRVVPVRSEALADQSAAREGFVLHKITPEQPMKPGEYALVLYTGEMRTAGFFAQAANSYFDFGID
jgi:hypothetical protein